MKRSRDTRDVCAVSQLDRISRLDDAVKLVERMENKYDRYGVWYMVDLGYDAQLTDRLGLTHRFPLLKCGWSENCLTFIERMKDHLRTYRLADDTYNRIEIIGVRSCEKQTTEASIHTFLHTHCPNPGFTGLEGMVRCKAGGKVGKRRECKEVYIGTPELLTLLNLHFECLRDTLSYRRSRDTGQRLPPPAVVKAFDDLNTYNELTFPRYKNLVTDVND